MEMPDFLRDAVARQTRKKAEGDEQQQLDDSRDEDQLLALETLSATRARLDVAALLLDWIWDWDGDALDGEGFASSLVGALAGVVEGDDVADESVLLSENDDQVFRSYLEAADELLQDFGVSEADSEAILSDEDEPTAIRVRAMLAAKIEPEANDFESLIVGFGLAPMMPVAELTVDSVGRARGWTWARRFRGRTTIHSRHGKAAKTKHKLKHKTWAKASVLQKAALRKARRRAHTATATMLNKKSNARTRKQGGRKVA